MASKAKPRYACNVLRRIDPELVRRARELRNNPTPTELAVWHRISRYRPPFTRQHIEPPLIIDLACRRARLAVEFDGSQHADTAEADERRSEYLRTKGWRVVRLWNSDVLTNPDGATAFILAQAAEFLGSELEATPSREGRVRKPRHK